MMRRPASAYFVLFLCLVFSLAGSSAFASHLRGTSVSWAPTGVAGTVQFTIQYSQRTSYGCGAGACVLNGTVGIPFAFGDGASTTVNATITSLNAAEDYLSATGTVTHTYSDAGPYTAYYLNSARVSTIISGSGEYMRMETLVSPFANPPNSSPVSSMPAIVTVPLAASTGFTVTAVDPDGDPISFRLSTASEMYNNPSFSCAAEQPPGLSISNTGQVTWDTTQITQAGCGFAAPASGDLWTVQFMIQDLDANGNVKTKTPLDLIIKFITTTEPLPTVTSTAPTGPITATPGSPVTFTINANDNSPNSRVTFNVTGLPVGATATNTNQALTPPIGSTFSWTPTASQAGSYVVTYTVTNDTFGQTLSSYVINVPSALPPVTSCPTSLTAQYNSALSIPIQVSDPQSDALTVVWTVDNNLVHTDNVTASSSTTNLTFSQTFSTIGSHNVSVNTTNTHTLSSSCSIPVTVNAADQTITFNALPAITYGDPATALTATSTSGLPVTYTATGSCSTVNGTLQATAAGNCSVTASQAGTSNYNAAQLMTQTFQIAQRPLTVTPQNVSRQYGVANPAFIGTVSGVANNDAITATYASPATISSPVGTYAIVPTLSGTTLSNYAITANNGTLTVTPGPASKLASSVVATTITSGGNMGTVTTLVQDANGNTVTTSTATVTATITGPNGYSQAVTAPAVNGAATLNLSALNLTTAGTYTVTTGSSGLTGTSATVTVSPGAASKLATSTVASSLTSGSNLGTLTATVEDTYNNTVPSSTAAVTAAILGPNGYSHTVTGTAVNGVASLNLSSLNLTTAGTYTVLTSGSGLAGTSAVLTVTPGAASKLATSEVASTLTSGGNLGSVNVTVEDSNNNTVTSSTAVITATITGPNGYSHTVTGTAVSGVASLNLSSLNLTAAGSYILTTSSAGSTGISAAITVTPGAASAVTTSTVATTIVSGGNLGTVTATIKDANGNTVTSSTTAVTATIIGPNGYSQTVTVAAVNGVANLNLSSFNVNTTGNYILTVSSPGLTDASSTVQVTPGAASKLVTSAVALTMTSGNNLGTVTATVEDANGNTVTNFNGAVTATITGANGYSQAIAATAVNGVASLNLSSLNLATVGTYTVATSSPGSTGTSAAVTVTPGAPAKLVLGGASTSITSGQSLGTVTATVEDANGNVATSYNGPITATLTGSDGSTRTVAGTAVNGVVTLDLSSLTPTASGSYTLSVRGSGPGLSASTSGASAPISVTPAPQTIVLPTLPDVSYGTAAGTLPTTSSAGLPIIYTVTGPAVMNGSTLTITGAGTVTITATQAGDASHSPIIVSKSFVVAQARTTTTLATSSGIATTGMPVTLTATVTSTAGVPPGTVTFLNGAEELGTVVVSSTGVTTLTLSNLPTGALGLSASYSGNANYSASTSGVTDTSVQDFAIAPTAGTPSAPVVPGAATSFTILLTPSTGGFSGAVRLTATGMPAGTTYSFSPATVTPGSADATTVLTVQTARPIATARGFGGAAGVAFALLALPFSMSRRARRAFKETRFLSLLGALLLLGSIAGLSGCGSGNGFFGEAPNTYTVVVTGTSGSLVHSTEVVINVQ